MPAKRKYVNAHERRRKSRQRERDAIREALRPMKHAARPAPSDDAAIALYREERAKAAERIASRHAAVLQQVRETLDRVDASMAAEKEARKKGGRPRRSRVTHHDPVDALFVALRKRA